MKLPPGPQPGGHHGRMPLIASARLVDMQATALIDSWIMS